jgi:Cd2+/Zn2+-exporting ATPase
MDVRPDRANVRRGGEVLSVNPSEVAVGETVIVKAGERVPLDGVVAEGVSALDTSALTGESIPREVAPGSEILSGCINMNGLLTVTVTKSYGESTVSKILALAESAASKKARTENFIRRFAKGYTPAVVIMAAIISFVPPLFMGWGSFHSWVYRGLTFLVISCPCALVMSIPLSFFGGIGGASRRGILVKGGNYLEALANLETVVFDKTGTLTKGVFNIVEVIPTGMDGAELLELAALAESGSNHPISQSLRRAYGAEADPSRVTCAEELPGFGVRAAVDGRAVLAGNAKLMAREGISHFAGELPGTAVHVAVGGAYAGYIVIADEVKPDAAEAIRGIREAGVRKAVMLTGDAKAAGERIAAELGLDGVYTGLLPDGKLERLEELLAGKPEGSKLAYMGDGVNDAPVLARADGGIAMGGIGSDAAIEAADVVIMNDEPSKALTAVKIARRTLRIVKQNIALSLGIKAAVLVLAALGLASIWAGVLADVGVALLALLNATRALDTKGL